MYPRKKWNEVLTIVSGKNQKAVENPDGKYPIYGSGGIIGHADDYLCGADTVIVGRKGTIDNPLYVSEPFWNIDTAFGVVAGEELLPKYLFYFCRLFNFKSLDKSTGRPSIAKSDLLKIEMPVPEKNIQERIVAQIEELFSELDNAEATLQATKQQLAVYRQAVLREAFEGRLTKNKVFENDIPFASEEELENLPILPKEWKYVHLSELGDLGRGKSKHRPRNDNKLFIDGKYPFIQTGDVKAAKDFITEYSKSYGEFGLQQSKLWPEGTLCITIAANIAETAFLGMDACFPDSVVGFTPYEVVKAEYVRFFIESQKLRLWAFAPATAQKNINLDTLEKLIIPLCGLEEQGRVVDEIESRLSECDAIEQTVYTTLLQLQSMRQSVLKEAFEGRL